MDQELAFVLTAPDEIFLVGRLLSSFIGKGKINLRALVKVHPFKIGQSRQGGIA